MALVSFAIEVSDGGMDGSVELLSMVEGPVGEVMALEVEPVAFDVVKFGRVGGRGAIQS